MAKITSQRHRAAHPSRVEILLSTPAGKQSGLLKDSVVMTDNLATIFETAIDRGIGSLPVAEVDQAVRTHWGCEVPAVAIGGMPA